MVPIYYRLWEFSLITAGIDNRIEFLLENEN